MWNERSLQYFFLDILGAKLAIKLSKLVFKKSNFIYYNLS